MKRVGILLVFIFFGGGFSVAKSMDTQEVSSAMIEKYQKTPMWQLLGIADAFLSKGANDSAMICYSLIYNSRMNQEDTSSKKIVCKALNRASNIYFYHCDYKSSIQLLLMALQICDEIGYKEYVASVYNNIGSVYFQFKDNKKAKKYYELSNKNSHNAYFSGVVLNNLALLACRENKLDSALILYKKACRIIEKEVLDSVYNETLNNIGNVYYTLGHYDSAFFYYCKALDNARKFKMASKEAYILSDIGRLYYHRHKYDSADYYLKMGNKIAIQYKLYSVLANNYLSFSEIQESQGNISQALAYYKKYDIIKDSLFNSSKYASIQELEFSYNMTKIDKKIQKLNVEQEIKERTIAMQKRLQLVTSLAVLALSALLVLMYRKNKNLNQAYNKLVVKNVEIVNFEAKMQFMQVEYEYKLRQKDLKIEQVQQEQVQVQQEQENTSELSKEGSTFVKYKDIQIGDISKKELLSDILKVMRDKTIYCDPEFSVLKLADKVNSNSSYVSYTINNTFGKNFRSFINDYRIKEACRILAEEDMQKYAIESIAIMVGFKSKSAFNTIFKEVTGVTPSFYIKSVSQR